MLMFPSPMFGKQVTESGGGGPAGLTVSAWYDPADLATLFKLSDGTDPVTADGDPVGYLGDKSGNGHHMIQATVGKRPIYKTDGTLHWLQFDGSDDGLRSAGTISDGISCFTALRADTGENFWLWLDGGPGIAVGIVQSGDGSAAHVGPATPTYRVDGADVAATRAALYTALGESAARVLEARTMALSAWPSIALFDNSGIVFAGRMYQTILLPDPTPGDRATALTFVGATAGLTL